jgi:hypothetical protein
LAIRILLLSVLVLVGGVRISRAAIAYTLAGSTYNQNFNTLVSSGNNFVWTNDSLIAGWSLFRVASNTDATPVAMHFYDASDGSATTGRFYSFGTSSDRALGGIGNGIFGYPSDLVSSLAINKPAGWMAASFSNSTGTQLTRFTVAYDGEQWRDGGNGPDSAQSMNFEYGFGTDFSTVSIWTAPGSSFNFTSPVFTSTAGPVDGNNAGLVANLGGTVTNLAWQAGDTLWVRWIEQNDAGADAGLAIDNFSFSANLTAVPEAGAFALGALVSATIGGLAIVKSLSDKRRTTLMS